MPSSIPYDPSLTLGNVVDPKAIQNVEKIAAAQGPVDTAQDYLNSLIASRRSLDMTKTELLNLGIDTKPLVEAVDELNQDIGTAAGDYITKKIAAEKEIKGYRADIRTVHSSSESPVDFVKTQIKTMPLAADSMNMDVQYFSMDTNEQSSEAHANAISSYLSSALGYLGSSISTQISQAAQSQTAKQASKHSIAGTLVLSVSCTHKNASILAPFILNVDKGIKTWNDMNPGDTLTPEDADSMQKVIKDQVKADAAKYNIISGMTFGSSFVGMVHILNVTDTKVTQNMSSIAGSLQAQMDTGAWFEKASGGFGVNTSFSSDVKNLLSSQNISSHVTLISMGVIPSMVASSVKMAVKEFSNFDPKTTMDSIATVQNATVNGQDAVKSSADSARTGKEMITMKNETIKAALSAVGDLDDGANKILDINSMMTALDDYLKKAAEGNCGVPINYYLKDITKLMLAEMWASKYYPGKYLQIKGDDSTDKKEEPAPE